MSYLDEQLLLKLLQVCSCGALGWACLCRINAMSIDTTRPLIRAAYSLLFAVAVAVGTAPWWATTQWAEIGVSALAIGYVIVMLANSSGWRHGPPAHARTRPVELAELDTVPMERGS